MAYLRRTASLSHRVIGGDGAAKRRRTTAAAIVPRPPIYPPPLTPQQAQQDACISIPSLVYDETAVQAHEEMILIAAAWVGITSQKSHPFQKSNDLLGFKSFARRHIDYAK